MIVRQAADGDTGEWLRMRLALWPDTSPEEHRREIDAVLASQGADAVFVAVRQEGGLAGFLEASVRRYADGCESRQVGYIEGWWVDADVRRQGVGARLVRAAEDWARQRGYQEMASDCLIDNLTSWQAHLALGYQEKERLIHFCKKLGDENEP